MSRFGSGNLPGGAPAARATSEGLGAGYAGHIMRRSARPSKPAGPTLRRAARLLYPHRWTVAAYLVTVVVTSLAGSIQPLFFQPIIDRALPHQDERLLAVLSLEMRGLVLFTGLSGVLRSYLSNVVGQDA